MRLEYTVGKEDAGRILKNLLRGRFMLSATQLRKVKNYGEMLVNGEAVYVTRTLSEGDRVVLELPRETPDFPPETGEPDIIYEDEYMLAVNKPEGMITHPSHSRYTGTLANIVLGYILSHGGEGCHAVNRLDRDTSGIVLFAKNSYAKSLLCETDMEKQYIAAVYGCPEPESGTVSLPIKRKTEGDMLRVTAPDGSPAVTHYETAEKLEGRSIVRLRLETGRTHQIRVHMLSVGCPVLGDGLYYTKQSRELSARLGITSQLLHAERLTLRHPISGELLELYAPPRGTFKAAL